MLKFQRGVHTRAKKVSVQLLKDFPHVGQRGEIVQVSEGLMRNKLHPGNNAAYLVNGPVIPIVKKEVKIASTKPAKIRETAAKPEKKQFSVLDVLIFDNESSSDATQPATEASTPASSTGSQPAASKGSEDGFEWQNEFVKKT